MSRIDESRPFLPVNIAVLTVSDSRKLADDKSGRTLGELFSIIETACPAPADSTIEGQSTAMVY